MNITYILLAIIIFATLRFLSHLLKSISVSKRIHNLLLRGFPLFEFLIWFGFGFWVLHQVFENAPYYNLIISAAIICILLVLAWYFLRDFMAGIIIKVEIPFKPNQRIRTSHSEGILKKTGYRSLEIESDSGELVKIPYSQLASNSIHLQNTEDTLIGQEILIKVKASTPIQDAKDAISKEILLLPWSSIVEKPIIKVSEQGEGYISYLVHFYTYSSRHASYICQHLKNFFEPYNENQIQ